MFSCEKCGREFTRKGGLTQHMKRKTPCVKPTEPEPESNESQEEPLTSESILNKYNIHIKPRDKNDTTPLVDESGLSMEHEVDLPKCDETIRLAIDTIMQTLARQIPTCSSEDVLKNRLITLKISEDKTMHFMVVITKKEDEVEPTYGVRIHILGARVGGDWPPVA